MKLRWGFKSQAERIALDIRREANVAVNEPIDIAVVAKRYGASVVGLKALAANGAKADSIRHFLRDEPGAFSALTVVHEDKAMIIVNEAHTPARVANSVAHETSHLVLEHERPSRIIVGCRQWDAEQESEADWLGGCILVPRPSAEWAVESSLTTKQAAKHFGVSEELMRMRINLTGVAKVAERRRKA